MKTLSESIIGRKSISNISNRKGQIPKSLDDLKYGDFVEISGGFGGTYLYVPHSVTNMVFNVDVDGFIRPSEYWTTKTYSSLFPYDRINKTHKIERIIGRVSKDEYENLKTKKDVSHLFNKYNIPSK